MDVNGSVIVHVYNHALFVLRYPPSFYRKTHLTRSHGL